MVLRLAVELGDEGVGGGVGGGGEGGAGGGGERAGGGGAGDVDVSGGVERHGEADVALGAELGLGEDGWWLWRRS